MQREKTKVSEVFDARRSASTNHYRVDPSEYAPGTRNQTMYK
ncbi:hypothetical protein [Cupriavidus consociatus]|nr:MULTISPECIES: hypothetical protein [unclassified Cupriavidus]MDK2655668.1 hypothetical protein [Cupriavidus sp. LEh21]